MHDPRFIAYRPPRLTEDVARARAAAFYDLLEARRCVRQFSDEPVARDLLESCVRAASTAPSGAHKQPWTYVAVSDPDTKRRIREAAESVERDNYAWRMSEEWKADLAPLGTDGIKEHLTSAPWVVVVFQQDFALRADGRTGKHYYVAQSVGISVGLFLAALQTAGLSALVHTPSPMEFLRHLLQRPRNERAFAVIPLGVAARGCEVPNLRRKSLDEVLVVNPPASEIVYSADSEPAPGDD